MARSRTSLATHHLFQRGFSLLEMMVAIAILGIALGVLYRAAGGASRIVQTGERYAYAVAIAESLLADNAVVPFAGLDLAGQTGDDFRWTVKAEPVPNEIEPPVALLMAVNIVVNWGESGQYELHSIVAGVEQQ